MTAIERNMTEITPVVRSRRRISRHRNGKRTTAIYFLQKNANLSSALFIVLLLIKIGQFGAQDSGNEECSSDRDCELLFRFGSKCVKETSLGERRICSNPYIAGCLASHHGPHAKQNGGILWPSRVCNPEDQNMNYCENGPLEYPPIRIHNSNWESVIFYSWILQIFLMEFLQVPASVGVGHDSAEASFYNPTGMLSYSSKAYAFDEIETANRFRGRCDATGEPCTHVLPEVWAGQMQRWQKALSDGHIEQVIENGQIGKISWYIPKYTAQRLPEFATYHGLFGRREQLADIFRTPVAFGDYCQSLSPTGCSSPDGVAERPPEVGEADAYFVDGTYIGYFQLEDRNNCTLYPSTCHGHIVGPECSWSTYVEAQAQWNDIALQSSGKLGNNSAYSHSQMIQIWRAANATKSDVVSWWFTPDATGEEFRGTNFEFQPILLPEPTIECRRSRILPQDRCHTDPIVRLGKSLGSCDNEPNSLQKVVASSLRDSTLGTPAAQRSPGYQAIRNLKVSHLEMYKMLRKWVDGGRTGFAARDAVCDWVFDHQEELRSFIPRGYPRNFVSVSGYQGPIFTVAIFLGSISILGILVCLFFIRKWRRKEILYYAQFSINSMILLGLFLVSTGSILNALEPQDSICKSETWLVMLGYTFELVPVLTKIAAINQRELRQGTAKRTILSRWELAKPLVSAVLLAVVMLSLCTALDAPKRTETMKLMGDQQTIENSLSCLSEEGFWTIIRLSWEGLFILLASVLTVQSRKAKIKFQQHHFGLMIYTHLVFFVLRAIVLNSKSIPASTSSVAVSYLLSLDVMLALAIYMVPLIYAARNGAEVSKQIINNPAEFDRQLSLRYSIRRSMTSEVGTASKTVQDIYEKAQLAMSEYNESRKSQSHSASDLSEVDTSKEFSLKSCVQFSVIEETEEDLNAERSDDEIEEEDASTGSFAY